MSFNLVFLLTVVLAFVSQALALDLLDKIGNSELYCKFKVKLDEPLKSFEKLGVSGNTSAFGNWSTDAVVFLEKTDSTTLWSGKVKCVKNSKVNYRYFVGAKTENGDLQVRKWETHVEGRTVDVDDDDVEISDDFGIVNGTKKVHRGWLNKEYILQLKLFDNPITLNTYPTQKFLIKVTPIDLDKNNTAIPPSAKAYVEAVRLKHGDSEIKPQPDEGVTNVRYDINMFHITTTDNKSIGYNITLYNEEDKSVIGNRYLSPKDLNENYGLRHFELFSPDDDKSSVGNIKISFLWIKPLPKRDPPMDFRTTFAHYWPKEWPTLEVAHNGLGKSLKINQRAAPIIEGTIASMLASAKEGADMIEFDVQCTKDHHTIIYHSYYITAAKDPSVEPTSSNDLERRHIKNMTYEELKNTPPYEAIGSSMHSYSAHNDESRKNWRMFPTLEELLEHVPSNIGMNIEVKWPQWAIEDSQNVDKNLFVDKIIDVILRKGCGRMLFYSSVDSDIMTMMRYKQNMYGGMNLGYTRSDFYADPRTTSYQEMVNYADTLELLGTVPVSIVFDQDSDDKVKMAKDRNLRICVWGDDIGSSKSKLDYYKSLGVQCLIYDRVDLLIDDKKEGFFSKGKFPKYFEMQCPKKND